MNTLNKIIPAIILLAFVSFLALLIVGMVIKSVPLIVSSFAIGFIGYPNVGKSSVINTLRKK